MAELVVIRKFGARQETDACGLFLVYNHVLRLDLDSLQWTLVDNYGDIPGVRMGELKPGMVCHRVVAD